MSDNENNTGNGNAGLWNTGGENTGGRNTGHYNAGNYNTGNGNIGDWNTGGRNIGDRNTGCENTGDGNTGDGNTGEFNVGDSNAGDWNTGNGNIGDWNTGGRNIGDRNTGEFNVGDWNTGDFNAGDCNTGDFNTGNRNTGYFCTETPDPTIFDLPATVSWAALTEQIREAMPRVSLTKWVNSSDMSDAERDQHPEHETTGGYLKSYGTLQEAWAAAWAALSPEKREEHEKKIRALPNFNADKFLACTGIDLTASASDNDGKPKVITIDGVEYHRKDQA